MWDDCNLFVKGRKPYLCFCAAFVASHWVIMAQAQEQKPLRQPLVSVAPNDDSIQRENPFSAALRIVNSGQKAQGRKNGKTNEGKLGRNSISGKTLRPLNSAHDTDLKFQQTYKLSHAQEQAIYRSLVRAYGQPNSIRGPSHVWDIKNPTSGGRQADMVTIIFKMDGSGNCELVMDRDRGEDGRATWADRRRDPSETDVRRLRVNRQKAILEQNND